MKRIFAAFLLCACALFPESARAKTLAEDLSEMVIEADAFTLESFSNGQRGDDSFSDRDWLEKVAAIISTSDPQAKEPCMCISFPKILLFKSREKLATLSVHHGERLRVSSTTASGDFFIGKESGEKIIELIKKRINDKAESSSRD